MRAQPSLDLLQYGFDRYRFFNTPARLRVFCLQREQLVAEYSNAFDEWRRLVGHAVALAGKRQTSAYLAKLQEAIAAQCQVAVCREHLRDHQRIHDCGQTL